MSSNIGEKNESLGMFAGFVLLSEDHWDKQQFLDDLHEEWEIDLEEDDDTNPNVVVANYEDNRVVIAKFSSTIPNNEAEKNASNNYMWENAVEVTKTHKAHLFVSVLGETADLIEKGKRYVKLLAACCKQREAIGIYTCGVVFEPKIYETFAAIMRDGYLPIFNWIWFGLYKSAEGVTAYTYGMDVFGKPEMEVVDAQGTPSDIRGFLANIVEYVIENDVTLRHGETIEFSENDSHKIAYSEGVSLPGQMTLKIT